MDTPIVGQPAPAPTPDDELERAAALAHSVAGTSAGLANTTHTGNLAAAVLLLCERLRRAERRLADLGTQTAANSREQRMHRRIGGGRQDRSGRHEASGGTHWGGGFGE